MLSGRARELHSARLPSLLFVSFCLYSLSVNIIECFFLFKRNEGFTVTVMFLHSSPHSASLSLSPSPFLRPLPPPPSRSLSPSLSLSFSLPLFFSPPLSSLSSFYSLFP